jgi:hypothetical protein
VSRLDHPSHKNSRRDDAATLPQAGESTTGRAPAARTAATAGAHHRHPGGWGWVVLALFLIGFGVGSCRFDEDAQPFCAEVACETNG